MRSHLSITIHGPATDGDVDVRCALASQDTNKRKPCPNGQTSLINAIKKAAGFEIADDGEYDDDVFTMPILVQDRSGFQSSLSLSNGELSTGEIVSKKQTETLKISLSDAVSSGIESTPYKVDLAAKIKSKTDLEIDTIISVITPGRLFNSSGSVVYNSGSLIQTSDDFLLLKEPVTGSITISYIVTGQEYTATISPRTDAVEYNYQSSLWVVSSCGEIQHFEIEVPDCWQQAWWGKNGFPSDIFDDDGEAEVIEPPNEAKPKDQSFRWELCGNKKAADNDTAGYFQKKLNTNAEICYPGVVCSDDCRCCNDN